MKKFKYNKCKGFIFFMQTEMLLLIFLLQQNEIEGMGQACTCILKADFNRTMTLKR